MCEVRAVSGLVNDWLPYIVLVVVYFALSTWIARWKQRKEAAAIKAMQDGMIAEYNRRHGDNQ